MNILVVVAHPRVESLTVAVAGAFAEGAREAGHRLSMANLYEEQFNPVMTEADDTDPYPTDIIAELERIKSNEAMVMVFPVWWWSMPAMLKGWIDRIWQNGLVYGDADYRIPKALMLALAGETAEGMQKRGYDNAMEIGLNIGIMQYCEVTASELIIFNDTDHGGERCAALVERARRLGREFSLE